MQKKDAKNISVLGFIALSAYLIFISWRLFFFAYSNHYRQRMDAPGCNLVPFKTIGEFWSSLGSLPFDVWIYNLAGNIAAFMPLGFFLAMTFKRFSIQKTVFVAFILIVLAEAMQLVTLLGVFDVDDIILNVIGSFFGCIIYQLCRRIFLRLGFVKG